MLRTLYQRALRLLPVTGWSGGAAEDGQRLKKHNEARLLLWLAFMFEKSAATELPKATR